MGTIIKKKKNKYLIFLLIPFFLFVDAYALSESEKKRLEGDLNKIENEIKGIQVELDTVTTEKETLENVIKIIDGDIRKEQLGIQARNININNIVSDIGEKESTIEELNDSLDRRKNLLSDLLQLSDEMEQKTFMHIFFSDSSVSDYFVKINDYESLQGDISKNFEDISRIQRILKAQQENLSVQKEEEYRLREIQRQRKLSIEKQRREKEVILDKTKGVESNYQKILNEKEKTAAEIRSQLFVLRGSNPIPFELAVRLAKQSEAVTGVRAAFILAVITQETELGEFLGNGSWRDDLHPVRDMSVFKTIAKTLRINPDDAPVSKSLCSDHSRCGWGGAMGPAQFIPSTWACYGGYINDITKSCAYSKKYSSGSWTYVREKDKIRSLLSLGSASNPWEPKTAFTAAALLLRDNGARAQTSYAEWCAALRYYSGSCTGSRVAQNRFYADSVIKHAKRIQGDINIIDR